MFTVKANQPGLFARCKALPWAKIRAASATDFAGAVQVAQIRRTRTQAGNKSVEVVYVITSLPSTQASPTQIATWAQGTPHGSWPPCAPPRSASYASPAPAASPARPDNTPATPTDPSNYS